MSQHLKICTLKKRTAFLRLRHARQLGGADLHRHAFRLQCAPQIAGVPPHAGIGYTVTKKIGNAVVRNRVKRRLRAGAIATLPKYGQAGFDYVLIAKPAALSISYEQLLTDLQQAFKACGSKSRSHFC